jgi:hypothetical protein
METNKCNNCESEISENDYCNYDKEDNALCEECYYSSWEDAVKVFEYNNTEEVMTRIDYSYSLNKSLDCESWEEIDGTPECIKSAEWKSTSAWRGYVDVEIADGYECIANGWSTGSYEDVKWKWDFNEFFENISEGNITPPVPVWFIFSRTSNVFSTATDIVVRENQVDTFLDWLSDEAGMTRNQLKMALS